MNLFQIGNYGASSLHLVGTGQALVVELVGSIMTERERQAEFLKSLLTGNTDECNRLRQRLRQAQHDEHCIRRALILMVLVGVVSIVGLGYCAVLLPEFFDNATPLLVKVFCALGLGSLICMTIFGGCWLFYRKASNQVNEDCRHFIADTARDTAAKVDFDNGGSVIKPTSTLYQIETPQSSADSRIIQFPRAS
jgi:hypothetical protein